MAETTTVAITPEEEVSVVTVPMYVLLKLVAYTDRRKKKDIDGVQHCLRHYAPADDRRYGLQHEGTSVPFEYGSAHLLGLDARPILDEKLRGLIFPLLKDLAPPLSDEDEDEPYQERQNRAYWRWFHAGLSL